MTKKLPPSLALPFDPKKKGLESFLGPTEAKVLEAVYALDRPRVREVLDLLSEDMHPAPAYTTVMTTLDRLFQKKLLDRTREGKGFRYFPRGDRATLWTRLFGSILSALAREASTDLPLQLSEELSPEQRDRLQALLASDPEEAP